MEERSLRVVATDKTFFNKLTNTLTKFLIPTQIGFNSLKISMKRNVLIKTYETLNAENAPVEKKEELEKRIQKVAAAGKLSRFKGNVFEVLENCNDYEKNLKLIKRII